MIKTKQELLNHFSDINAMYNNPFMYQTLSNMIDELLEQQPCEDAISREAVRQELQEHLDFFVNAYGGFKDMPYIDKARVDEIDNCIAMVVNEPSVTPSYNSIKTELEPCEDCISRIEAIENFASWYGYDYDNQGYYRLLKQMPAVTPEQPFINKPCISEGVCHEDKVNVLEKIRAEIKALEYLNIEDGSDGYDKYIEQYEVLKIINKYKAESEDAE